MFTPKHLNKLVLPKFKSSDKGLEDALNTLARAIENIEIPDVRLVGGTMEWTGGQMLLTPEATNIAAEERKVPLTILSTRPAYIPASEVLPGTGSRRFYIEWGVVNEMLATNWSAYFDVGVTTYFFAKIMLSAGDSFGVTSWEIVTGPASNTHATPEWEPPARRPAYLVVLLGVVTVTTGEGGVKSYSVSNSGGGSVKMYQIIERITQGEGGPGDTVFFYQTVYHRLPY